jgi:hypothetical protein
VFLTRFRTYKIAKPPQTKSPVKTTFKVWCLDKFLYPWEKGIIAEPSRGDSLRIQLTWFADLFVHGFSESLWRLVSAGASV